jgi:uncharacterized protein (TIGR02246 family)
MRTTRLLASAALLGLLASPAFGDHHEGSAQECWKPAFAAGDADAVSACYADDAVLWLPGAPMMKGREAIRAGYADFFSHFTIKSMELTEAGHRRMGDDAASWGSFRLVLVSRADGKEVVELGRYTDISRRIDGQWRYVVDHASDEPAETP